MWPATALSLQSAWREITAQEPDLELVERVEREPPPLDRMAPPLDRVFDALQRNQRVDAADGAQPRRRRSARAPRRPR